MTTEHDARTSLVVSWLREDGHENAERALLAALNDIDHTRQRRPWWPAWRFPDLNTLAKLLVAAAAVVAVTVAGINLIPDPGNGPGAVPPSPSPSPSPTIAPTAAPGPTESPEAGLPIGPFVVDDAGAPAGGPTITVHIPSAGWSYSAQFTALGKGVDVANLPEATILVWANEPGTEFWVPGDSCKVTSTWPASPATTVDEIAAALGAQASRDASEPVDVTIGGYPAKSLTLHVPDDAVFSECEEGKFVTYGTSQDRLARFQQGPGQIDELWILDVDGAIVIMDAMYRSDTSAELQEELRSIARSATFDTP